MSANIKNLQIKLTYLALVVVYPCVHTLKLPKKAELFSPFLVTLVFEHKVKQLQMSNMLFIKVLRHLIVN